MRRATVVVLAFFLFLAAPVASAFADDLKIGVVDVEYVIHNSKKGKAAKGKLKKLFEEKQKELDGRQKGLLELKKQIEAQSDMATPDKRKAKVLEYQQGLLSLQEIYLKNQQELAKKEMDFMKPILKAMEEHLTKMAADGSYDFIMNRSEQGVLFAKPDHDLTKVLLDKLDGN